MEPTNVFQLGWAAARPSLTQMERIAALDPTSSAEVLRFNKVTLLAMAHLSEKRVAGSENLLRLLDKITEAKRMRQKTYEQTLAMVKEVANSRGLQVALMKGAAARSWYSDPNLRNMNDMDLWVPNGASAWELTEVLINNGWKFNPSELPWHKATFMGDGYGVINLLAQSRDLHHIDLHFGAYSVRHCGYLQLSDSLIWEKDSVLPRHGDTEVLATIIGNAAGDMFITVKDVNDIVLCASLGAVDWDRLRWLLRGAQLIEFARSMVDASIQVYAGANEMPGGIARLREQLGTGACEPISLARPVASTLRAVRTARHAWRVGSARGPFTALRCFGTALVYYLAPLKPRVTRFGGDPTRRLRKAVPWRCVRLVPLDHIKNDNAQRVGRLRDFLMQFAGGTTRGKRDSVVRRRKMIFVPTVYGRISVKRVEEALAVEMMNG